jgi:tetratricopeptide (TPR) repeat protein
VDDHRQRGAPPGHRRISPVPPPPVTPYPDWAVLEDQRGALGHVLWRVAADVLLWTTAPEEDRSALFQPSADADSETLAYAMAEHPELSEALRVLWSVHKLPELADRIAIAGACSHIAGWAEAAGMKITAIQFAELAARLMLDSSVHSFTAARLCRRQGEQQRSAIWYRRALRLGRLADNQIDIANARLGMGNLESDLGNMAKAEGHFWKAARAALRNGRRSLAAAAFHNLIGVTYDSGRKADALEHLQKAARCYDPEHPRFPAFAYDAGFFLMREGYFSSALLLFETVLPRLEGDRVSILVRSALARSAAAVRDNIRYTRQSTAVLAMAAVDDEDSANALYQIAEGARSFQDWERARALAQRALSLAIKRSDSRIARYAEALIGAIERREPGDVDRVPPEDDPIDSVTQDVLRKLKKKGAQVQEPGAPPVPPERYPTE